MKQGSIIHNDWLRLTVIVQSEVETSVYQILNDVLMRLRMRDFLKEIMELCCHAASARFIFRPCCPDWVRAIASGKPALLDSKP